MKSTGYRAFALTAAIILGACNSPNRHPNRLPPTAPSPLPPNAPVPSPAPLPPPPPPVKPGGEITLTSMAPASGATLEVHNCRVGSAQRTCADGINATFEILLAENMNHPVLAVGFYDGSTRCGFTAATPDHISEGRRISVSISAVYLSFDLAAEPSAPITQPCSLPAMTTRIVATLWTDAHDAPVITNEFSAGYTFATP